MQEGVRFGSIQASHQPVQINCSYSFFDLINVHEFSKIQLGVKNQSAIIFLSTFFAHCFYFTESEWHNENKTFESQDITFLCGERLRDNTVVLAELCQQPRGDCEQVTAGQGFYLSRVSEGGTHHHGVVAKLLVIVVNLGHTLYTWMEKKGKLRHGGKYSSKHHLKTICLVCQTTTMEVLLSAVHMDRGKGFVSIWLLESRPS